LCGLIRRIICLSVILLAVFIALSLWRGGDEFRWFGSAVQKTSDELANKADNIKDTKDKVKDGTKKAVDKVEKTTGALKEIIDKKDKDD
jgi:methyl-accepting chemotaxis protein